MPVVYDAHDPSTWGPVIGQDAKGNPVYQNQPNAASLVVSSSAATSGQTPLGTSTPITTAPTGSGLATAGSPGTGPAAAPSSGGNSVPWLYNEKNGLLGTGIGGDNGLLGTGLLGNGKGSANPNQYGVAQGLVGPTNAAAGAAYDAAMEQAQAASQSAAPGPINTPNIAAAQLDANAYNTSAPTTAYASDATGAMREYTAAQAKAALNSPNSQAAQAVSQANLALPANVSSVNTDIQAPKIGPAAQTGLVTVGNTELSPSATALQGQELQAANNIANGPSAAMSQFQAGQSQVVKDQLAAAAAARGSDRAGARREAMLNIGASGAQQNLSAAALAAQETQSKNVAASTALQGIGSQALTAATTQANITSQQQQLQAQLDAAVSQGNTAAINSIQAQQAQLGLQAQTASATAGLGQQATMASLATTNMAAANQNAQYNATAANQAAANYAAAQNAAMAQNSQTQTGVNQANAGATNAALAAYTGAQNTAGQNYAAQAAQTSQANVQTALAEQQANAARALAANTTNVTNENAANTANASNALSAAGQNAGNILALDQVRNTGTTSALGAATNALGPQVQGNSQELGALNSDTTITTQKDAGVMGMVSSAVGAYAGGKKDDGKNDDGKNDDTTSDERAKVDIATVGGGSPSYADKYGQMLSDAYGNTATANPYGGTLSDERTKREVDRMGMDGVANFTRKAPAVTFRYKPGIEDGGAAYKAGTLAQGVEAAGPLGRMFVDERPDGLKEVQYGPMAHFEAKGAQHTADRALAVASAAYRRAR